MIYYPLSVLMLAGIRDILIITTPDDQAPISSGCWGMAVSSAWSCSMPSSRARMAWRRPLSSVKRSLAATAVMSGAGRQSLLRSGLQSETDDRWPRAADGATVFGYQVMDPERFGVVEFDDEFNALSLWKRSRKQPKSRWAVTGLYFLRQ